jgi:hypothetical protein
MAKNSVRDYSATAASNTDVQSVDIDEGCAPSGINNAIREVMADIKDVSTGTVALESPSADSMTVTGDLTIADKVVHSGDTNTSIRFPAADTVTVETGGSERVRILAGGGLTFNGDTAAANALDDYEEGTWTPTLSAGASRQGTWDSALTGTYTKIGRMVMITFKTTGTSMSFSASGGYSRYTGLPFAVEAEVGASWSSGSISGAGAGTVFVDTSERVWIYAPLNTTFTTNAIYTSFVYYTS